jgi:hypothetical protein
MIEEDEFLCSGPCGTRKPRSEFTQLNDPTRQRPVHSHCMECRREDYYRLRYDTVCGCCTRHRPIEADGLCKGCLEELGLRLCRRCQKILPNLLSFYGKRRKCKECMKAVDASPE